jgi:hypothetical protein
MAEAIDSPRLYPAGDLGPVVPQMVVYGVLAVVFLAVGEFLRFRRWRGFNYHYDMPAA